MRGGSLRSVGRHFNFVMNKELRGFQGTRGGMRPEGLLQIDGAGQAERQATIGRDRNVVRKMSGRGRICVHSRLREDAGAFHRKDVAANLDAGKSDAQVTRIICARGGFSIEDPSLDGRTTGNKSLVVDDDGIIERALKAVSGTSGSAGNRLREVNRQGGTFWDSSRRDQRLRRGGALGRVTVEGQFLGSVGIGNACVTAAGADRELQE
jgi:hypothetical protein